MVMTVTVAKVGPHLYERIPQTMEISRAVGMMWKTIDVRRKEIPFVPRSMALVRPPVWRERCHPRSRRKRCVKTDRATRRMDL